VTALGLAAAFRLIVALGLAAALGLATAFGFAVALLSVLNRAIGSYSLFALEGCQS